MVFTLVAVVRRQGYNVKYRGLVTVDFILSDFSAANRVTTAIWELDFFCGGAGSLQGGLKGLGARGVFLLEVQYSILKSLISTCVLSYVGSREDWLLDRICES